MFLLPRVLAGTHSKRSIKQVGFDGPIMKPQIASLRAANSLPYEIMMAVEPSTGFQSLFFMIYESHLS